SVAGAGYMGPVVDQVNAAVCDESPPWVLPVRAKREAKRALHHALEDRCRRRVVGDQRMWQARVPLALAQQRDFGLEQEARLREKCQPPGPALSLAGQAPALQRIRHSHQATDPANATRNKQ